MNNSEILLFQIEDKRKAQRNIATYNLDVIISVGYRVKSHNSWSFKGLPGGNRLPDVGFAGMGSEIHYNV